MGRNDTQLDANLSCQIPLSVVMPVFNAEPYLSAALESVLSQTFSRFEVIAIDDGSTDQSAQILERFAREDSRIRVISISRCGLARALNIGMRAADGEFIARMDADDICLPDRFQQQLAFMAKNPDVIAVGASYLFIDEDGEPLCPRTEVYETHEQIDAAHFNGKGGAIGHPTVLMRRAPLSRIGFYRELDHCEDLDLWLRMAEVGRLANLPDVLLKYRLRVSSVSAQLRQRRREFISKVITDANQRRGANIRPGVIDELKPLDRVEYAHECAWMAIGAGNVGTAQKHARRAIALSPLSPRSWRLALSMYLPVGVKRSVHTLFGRAARIEGNYA
jgi:glycosyltransferase involved in cell wall biosynthesis